MAGKIPADTIQAIRDRISIVEVVSSYVALRKAGRNHLGLCPFHNEKTPSFTVNEERGLFHCFGCGVGGTVFTFLMRLERLEFPDAVANLARRAGIALPERHEAGPGAQQRDRLLEVNEVAARFFRYSLGRPEADRVQRYVAERGVAPAIAERFGLGYAPASGTALIQALEQKRIEVAHAVELGLVGRSPEGRLYDKFRGRLMFPIRRSDGQVIGFGGRILDGNGPKYLNSPESPLFRKGEGVYGLFEARDAIRDADRVILVEGYLDALALVQAGIAHTVATLGTALTVAQLRLLRRFTLNVIAFFDGDAAGQKAAERGFAISAEAGVWARGAFLPSGFDPDTFVRQHGAAATKELLEQATPLVDFFLSRVDPGRTAPVPERARAAAEVVRVLALVKDPFERDILMRRAAERLGVSEDTMRRQQTAGVKIQPRAAATPPQPATVDSMPPAEALLVEVMALDREVAQWAQQRGIMTRFHNADLAAAGAAVVEAWESGAGPESLLDSLPSALAARLTAAMVDKGPLAGADHMKIAEDCVTRIDRRSQRDLAGQVSAEIRRLEQHGNGDEWRQEVQRRQDLLQRQRGGA